MLDICMLRTPVLHLSDMTNIQLVLYIVKNEIDSLGKSKIRPDTQWEERMYTMSACEPLLWLILSSCEQVQICQSRYSLFRHSLGLGGKKDKIWESLHKYKLKYIHSFMGLPGAFPLAPQNRDSVCQQRLGHKHDMASFLLPLAVGVIKQWGLNRLNVLNLPLSQTATSARTHLLHQETGRIAC